MKKPLLNQQQRFMLREAPASVTAALCRLSLAFARLGAEIMKFLCSIGLIEKDNGNDQKTTTQSGI